jgi:hypothetical protein
MNPLTGKKWWVACGLVFALSMGAVALTVGDFGLSYDEPAYRYSQLISSQWWESLVQARSREDLAKLLDSDALLFYWPYGRHGINFHPPLAGQISLLTHIAFGRWMKDIPARRMASVLEFVLAATILFGFLARRYGPWVGGVAATALILMPRLYGQAHLIDTDIPGLFLWAATAVAFWRGLSEPGTGVSRALVGVLMGLAFIEKMGAVMVLLPLVAWLAASRLPRLFSGSVSRLDLIDAIVTLAPMLVPLGLAYVEIRRLTHAFLAIQRMIGVFESHTSPARTNLFRDHPVTAYPGAILLIPLAVWCIRWVLRRLGRRSPLWGAERPALEIMSAILAFAPAVGWLGNPAWWREALPRLAHYYAITTTRRGVLPDIQILYFGQSYEYSLPWHNAWVLIGITVPVTILVAASLGLLYAIGVVKRDRIPLYFLVHFLTLPILRMLPTPAHDGVRLFLPTFFFLAAFAGWGVVFAADAAARILRLKPVWTRSVVAVAVLVPPSFQLISIHPYELSYFNEVIGGPRGAWNAGFELSYWYDAMNPATLEELNAGPNRLPIGASISYANEQSNPVMVLQDLQALGQLRGDLRLDLQDQYKSLYIILLTHDSKASALTRLLFGMEPWYESRPSQLDHLRVLAILSPLAITRAMALQILLDAKDDSPRDPPAAPAWVRRWLPPLARLWGDGITKVPRLNVNTPLFEWAQRDPDGLRAAARALAARESIDTNRDAQRLRDNMARYDRPDKNQYPSRVLLRQHPEAVLDAVEILIAHPDALRTIMLRYPYTDPQTVGGYLDRDLKNASPERTVKSNQQRD